MIRVKNWNETFENAESRKLVAMKWIQCPAGVSSSGYIELMSHGDKGLMALGVFLAICQWSATCRPEIRGKLTRTDGRALTVKQIAAHLRVSEQSLNEAITILASEDVGWLIVENTDILAISQESPACLPPAPHASASEIPEPPAYITGQDITGQDITTAEVEVKEAFVQVLEEFNAAFGLSCRMTKNRAKALKARLSDPWWAENWRLALEKCGSSSFLRGKNDTGWKIDFEFFVRPDTVTKMLEGKYDDRQNGQKPPDEDDRFLRLVRIATHKGSTTSSDIEWRRANMSDDEKEAMRRACIRFEQLVDPKLFHEERKRLARIYLSALEAIAAAREAKANGQ